MARRIGFLVGVLVFVVAGSGSGLAQQATPATEAGPAWLVVQAFGAATLSPGPTAGAYTLTLTDVHPMALAFTDRPDRLVAHIPTADFAKVVLGEQADPLNATLVAPLPGGGETMVVVELLDATDDVAVGTVTYQVTVLAAEEGDLTAAAATPLPAMDMDLDFGPGHLFVDDVAGGTSGCSGSTGPTGYEPPGSPYNGPTCEPDDPTEPVVYHADRAGFSNR